MDRMKPLLLVSWLAVGWIPAARAMEASDGATDGIGPKTCEFYRYTPESGKGFI